jgi:hypothetical protein
MNPRAVDVAAAPLHGPSRLPVEGGKAHQNLPDGSDRPLAPLSRDGMPTVARTVLLALLQPLVVH